MIGVLIRGGKLGNRDRHTQREHNEKRHKEKTSTHKQRREAEVRSLPLGSHLEPVLPTP